MECSLVPENFGNGIRWVKNFRWKNLMAMVKRLESKFRRRLKYDLYLIAWNYRPKTISNQKHQYRCYGWRSRRHRRHHRCRCERQRIRVLICQCIRVLMSKVCMQMTTEAETLIILFIFADIRLMMWNWRQFCWTFLSRAKSTISSEHIQVNLHVVSVGQPVSD